VAWTPGSGGGGSSRGGSSGGGRWTPGSGGGGGGSTAPAKNHGFWSKGIPGLGKGLLLSTLKGLAVPGNASLGLVEFTRRGFRPTPGQTAGDVLFGKDEAANLNFRKALTGHSDIGGKGWGGRLLGLGDTIASAAIDPSTYLSFGTTSAAKLGAKEAGVTLGKAAAEDIAKVGAKKALSTADRLTLRTALASAEGGSEKSATKVLAALDRGGQGGIKFGGRTVVSGERLAPLVDPISALKGRALESTVGKAVVPRAGLKTAEGLGSGVADDVGAVFARARAAATKRPGEATDELYKAARAAKVTDAELRDIVGPALETRGAEKALPTLAKLEPFAQSPKELGLLKLAEKTAPAAKAANPFEEAARSEKAAKLADTLRTHGASADTARALRPIEWTKVARAAGVNNPSQTTRDLAASLLEGPRAVKAAGAAEEAAAAAAPKVAEAARPVRDMARTAPQAVDVPERLQPLVDLQARHLDTGAARKQASSLLPVGTDTAGDDLSRVLTAKGKAALERSPVLAERHFGVPLTSDLAPGGVLPRHLLEGKTSAEVERLVGDELRRGGRLKGNLLEHNPLVRTAATVARDERTVANRGAISELAKVRDPEGNPILSLADDVTAGTAKRPAGAVEWEIPGIGLVAAHPEVAKEVKRATTAISQPETLREFQGLLGHLNSLWKGYATVPVVGGPGFHMRNATGNVWNNFLAGVKNPADYTRATRIQRTLQKAGGDVAKLSDADRSLVELAQKHGVLGDGFFIHELTGPHQAGGKLGRAAVGNTTKNVRHGLNPLSLDNYAIRSGRSVGTAVENNARLAHFISKLRTLGNADEAARSVRKYLFDYADLTDAERGLKKVAAFYTFMRKNTPLQIAEMGRQPGKFTALARAHRNATIDGPEGVYPDWAVKEGMVPLPGGKLMVGADLPATSAMKVMDPSNALDQFGGLLPSLAKFAAEQKTGKSLFTGGQLKGSSNKRLLEALMPLVGKVERSPVTAKLTGDPQAPARALRELTGLNARVVTEGDRKGEEYRRFREQAKGLGGREVTIISGPKGGGASPELKALLKSRQPPRKAKGATKAPARRAWTPGR